MIMTTTNNIQLKMESILEKDFKKQVRGYNEVEVDEFLDIVIKDYEAFTNEIERLKKENDRSKKVQGQQATRQNIQITTESILEKDFKKQVRGYNEVEGDQFIDIVIKDYEAFTNEIERLKKEHDRLKKGQGQQATRQHATGPTQVNYDVLK